MIAAYAGNIDLVPVLCEQGARVDAVDTFGRMPFHFALRRAYFDRAFAQKNLGALYEMLSPTGIDLEVDGKLMRLSRASGEFFLLAMMMA